MIASRLRFRSVVRPLKTMTPTQGLIYFGPYEVTDQVFHQSTSCYALVNIKPVLPGHVLVIPYRPVQRVTQLTAAEVTDLFTTVQKVQKMLAKCYFTSNHLAGQPEDGSFNIAIQDGVEAGQTVPHLHCHVIPRTKDDTLGDGVYKKLEGEDGNVGGGHYDAMRPKQYGAFPSIEDSDRKLRQPAEMIKEAVLFRERMRLSENE